MFNNTLLLGSAKPCTHIIIPAYRGDTVPGSCGWVHNRPAEGSFTPTTIKNINVIAIYSYEGHSTAIMLSPEKPFNSIKITRLDTNKSIILPFVAIEYYARTGFFWRADAGKEIRLNIEAQ